MTLAKEWIVRFRICSTASMKRCAVATESTSGTRVRAGASPSRPALARPATTRPPHADHRVAVRRTPAVLAVSALPWRGRALADRGRTGSMSVDEARERNQHKAEAEAEHGPVREDPRTSPIGDAIEAFHGRGDLAFGIPAHRSGTGDVRPDAAAWAGEQAFGADVGMNNGVDTRHQSWQVEPTAMERFAQAVGADQTLFSTNGSSENVHVAMMTAVQPGETLVLARNGHKSAFAGLVLSGARPVYVDPVYDALWQVAHGVDPAELERVLDAHT